MAKKDRPTNGAEKARMEIIHICIAVRDVYESAKTIERLTGIGPFEISEPNYTNMTLHGKPADFKMRFGFAQAGPIRLELAQVLSGETIYDEFVKRKGYCLHHIGVRVDDIEQTVREMKARGIRVTESGMRPGAKFAYVDTEEHIGAILEVIEYPT
jgi:methylmalonyl-CoA/ethylmalonyl-CoA epimerase